MKSPQLSALSSQPEHRSLELPDFIECRAVDSRLEELKDNPFLRDELSLLVHERVRRYYQHILEKVEIGSNSTNSYVLYLSGKCDELDRSRGPAIRPLQASLPDIDTDFEVSSREAIIDYLKSRYGQDHVCQMGTFARMQGRGALKDVLRVHRRCSLDEINRITEHIPDESAIADHLQEMLESGEEPSIIRWALENNRDELMEWCFLNDEGQLDGPLSVDFAQAIRLEGTRRNRGKHASGVVICSANLGEVVPMMWDRITGQSIVAVDMRDAEKMGLVKFDILGTAVLDKLSDFERLACTGEL